MVNVYVVTYSSTRLHNQRIIKQTNKLRLIVIILDATKLKDKFKLPCQGVSDDLINIIKNIHLFFGQVESLPQMIQLICTKNIV